MSRHQPFLPPGNFREKWPFVQGQGVISAQKEDKVCRQPLEDEAGEGERVEQVSRQPFIWILENVVSVPP